MPRNSNFQRIFLGKTLRSWVMSRRGKPETDALLRGVFRELLCRLGRVAARHRLPEDVVWELVKGYDLVYLRARSQAARGAPEPGAPARTLRLEPHPGILYLLDKLDRELGQ